MVFLFFFSSRRRHTRFDCDWSSDVCSSDLTAMAQEAVSPSSSATAGLSRAEVLADLEMWHQAGMTYLPSPSADRDISYNSAEYQRGLARYQQLRSGPAYREAVRSEEHTSELQSQSNLV